MLSLAQLWLPIVASAIGVFVASSLVHMVFKWHNSEYRKLPNEDEVRAALRSSAGAPGSYFIPHMSHHKEMRNAEMAQKFVEGPVAMVTMRRAGAPSMGAPLFQWFLLNIFVAIVAGYLASKSVPVHGSFLAIARPVSIVAFLAYGGGAISNAIWMGKPWSTALKELLDAAIYAVVTACVFGWLWPAAAV
jgi:hypothetical protein